MSARRTLRWITAVLIATTAACGPSVGQPTPQPPSGATPGPVEAGPTAWDQVLDEIGPNGEVSLDTALRAFALAYGPMPGVELPDGPSGEIDSGTLAMQWLLAHWDELTDEQRQVAAERLGPSAPETATRGLGAPHLGGFAVGPSIGLLAAATQAEYQSDVDGFVAEMSAMLPRAFRPGTSATVEVVAYSAGIAKADAGGAIPANAGGPCTIRVYPLGQSLDPLDRRWLMAHETLHCFQHDLFGSSATVAVGSWIKEGQATWAAHDLVGPAPIGQKHWKKWLTQPLKPLFARAYDAAGILGHLADVASPQQVWGTLDGIYTAGLNGNHAAAFAAAESVGFDAFVDTWGSGYHRLTPGPWEFDSAAYASEKAVIAQIPIGNGSEQTLTAGAFAARAANVDLAAEVLTIAADDSHGFVRLPNGQESTLADLDEVAICGMSEPCKCPPGTPKENEPFIQAGPGSVLIGVTGHTAGGSAALKGQTLEDFCGATCLVGSWRLDNATYATFLGKLLEGADMTVSPATGRIEITFRADGTATVEAFDFESAMSYVSLGGTTSPSLQIEIKSTIGGSMNGHYLVELVDRDEVTKVETNMLTFPELTGELTTESTVTIEGQEIPAAPARSRRSSPRTRRSRSPATGRPWCSGPSDQARGRRSSGTTCSSRPPQPRPRHDRHKSACHRHRGGLRAGSDRLLLVCTGVQPVDARDCGHGHAPTSGDLAAADGAAVDRIARQVQRHGAGPVRAARRDARALRGSL